MKRVVITADDFGLAPEVNEAVERAHRDGILSATSLMVAEPHAADAVARARDLPGLRVGLHLALVEARAVLPARQIPDLLDPATARLRTDHVRYGIDIALKPRVRRQIRAEVTAQFEAFLATGLALDHVNAHQHFHVHPAVAGIVLEVGARYGMRALRVPSEPASVVGGIEPGGRPEGRGTEPWATWLGHRARRRGLTVPDAVFGVAWSGALDERRLTALLAHLPVGLTEIYAHPATRGGFELAAPSYAYEAELAALLSPGARSALRASAAALGGYADVA